MKQWVDYLWMVWSWALSYIFAAVSLWNLWLALQFVSGYNWITTGRHIGIAILMYLCGWFAHSDWRYRQDYYLKTYPEDC